ncbi:hypothetical protein HJC23_006946 [Cyclotella cryptica]|uniref:J domain-containing protein n=1 Tax=Cyclotella cryptica TaxID=29204 RepID=A0ABD3QNX1_9STRA|eukprot:CCRYP_004277-RA/>CCRYP_004277-RA protein AED:0.37 eAED:0.37 QI:0/-1/0/1/-1/1/1/0/424
MSADDNDDIEDLGNEALLFAYGHNVNLYQEVFNLPETSSTKAIYLAYTGLLKEIEVAHFSFHNYDDQDEFLRQYALRLGMKPCHIAVGMHPRDFLDIKTDAVKRAYQILADKESRKEYDACLREHLEYSEGVQQTDSAVSGKDDDSDFTFSSNDSTEEEMDLYDASSNDGVDSLYEASSVQGRADPDFPLLSSQHCNSDVFDPFDLRDDLSEPSVAFSESSQGEWIDTFDLQKAPIAPVTPDKTALSGSFVGLHPHGHEVSVRICALPTVDSDESTASTEYSELIDNYLSFDANSEGSIENQRTKIDPDNDIKLFSNVSSEEEDELVSFRSISKSLSEFDEKQSESFDHRSVGLHHVDCFSDDDDDFVEYDNEDNMSFSSLTKDEELLKENRHIWNCFDACMDEVSGTLDDTAVTIEQMCGVGK